MIYVFWTILCLLLVSKVIMNHGENWWCLIVKFSRILGISRSFSGYFGGFPNAGSHDMFQWSCEKSDCTTWETTLKSLVRRYAFLLCRRFSRSLATLNLTLTDRKSWFRTFSDDFAMFGELMRPHPLQHPIPVVWQIGVRHMMKRIEQFQDLTLASLRV